MQIIKNKKQQEKKIAGFTLIEMLAVLFIAVLMSTAILVNYNSGQTVTRVNASAQRLAADFRQAQNLALSGKAQGGVMPKGYGIYSQSSSQYVLFYNTVENSKFNPESIVLDTINLSDVTLLPVGVTVFFTPPNPSICVVDDADLPGVSNRDQVFTLTAGSLVKTVSIHQGGRVEIN